MRLQDGDHVALPHSDSTRLARELSDLLARAGRRNQVTAFLVKQKEGDAYVASLRERGLKVDDMMAAGLLTVKHVDSLLEDGTGIAAITAWAAETLADVTRTARADGRTGVGIVGTIAGNLLKQGRREECAKLETFLEEEVRRSSLPLTLLCPYGKVPSDFEPTLRRSHTSMTTDTEDALEPPSLELIREQHKTQRRFLDLVSQSRSEIVLLLPSVNAVRREKAIGVWEALRSAIVRGVRVRVLTPVDPSVERELPSFGESTGVDHADVVYRVVPEAKAQNTVTVLVVDGSASLVIEQRDDSRLEFVDAVGTATYSTINSTALVVTRFFERLWDETGLLEKESNGRRTAELLQDIMAHDLMNYNQIVRLNAELIRSENDGDDRVDAIFRAVEQSSALIDRAKKLGRILSQQDVKLYIVDLEASIQRSISTIHAANPERTIEVNELPVTDELSRRPLVVADMLLDEALTNVLSNCVKYTKDKQVKVQVKVEQVDSLGSQEADAGRYWKVSIADWGRGIPEEAKAGVFTRYQNTAKGSGLGLSIVKALVRERYSGEVAVRNRVENDYTQGTVIELWIPGA